jgi:hypothetical protein
MAILAARFFFAMFVLSLFDIDMLTIPGHSSHIIQAFDVAVASPLKTYYAERFEQLALPTIGELMKKATNIDVKTKAKELRNNMITAFVDAHRKATTYSNIKAGFKASVIVPFEPSVPLNNPRVAKERNTCDGVRRTAQVSTMLVTDHKNLNVLSRLDRNIPLTHDNAPTLQSIISITKRFNIGDGITLTPLPDIFDENGLIIYRVPTDTQHRSR